MYKLKVTFDEQAKMVSLGEFVPPEKMFNENYAHRASMSKTMQKAYKELNRFKFPITEKIHKEVVSIPLAINLKESQQKKIIRLLNEF